MGQLIILTGPSTSGKTTIAQHLPFRPLITTTTRPPRPGEEDGVDYRFLTEERYHALQQERQMPESTIYAGVHYGIMKEDLDRVYEEDHVAVLDVRGIIFCQRYFGKEHVIPLYIGISEPTLIERLQARGSSDEEIALRIAQARQREWSPAYRAYCEKEFWNEGVPLETTIQAILDYIRQR